MCGTRVFPDACSVFEGMRLRRLQFYGWKAGSGALWCALLLLCFASPIYAQLTDCTPGSLSADTAPCKQRRNQESIRDLLVEENFSRLDAIANKFRDNQTREHGDYWKLESFYDTLSRDQPDDEGGMDYVDHLEHWVAQKPDSVTARIALATAYYHLANSGRLRPRGFIPSHDPDLRQAWLDKAKATLAEAAHLPETCPEWYLVAMNHDYADPKQLFDDGTALAPQLFTLYALYAVQLWLRPQSDDLYAVDSSAGRSIPFSGGASPAFHPGLAADFAGTSADRIGGVEGDILYFRIAALLGHSRLPFRTTWGNEFPIDRLDWARIQRGYMSILKTYGGTAKQANEMALMAWKYQDLAVARQLSPFVSQNPTVEVWETRERFDKAMLWAKTQP